MIGCILSYRRLFWLIFWHLIAISIHAQQPYFIEYNKSNGLASNLVYDILQDQQGYIWIATDVGVHRFDGKRFTHYTMSDGLSDNEVLSLFEDSKGRIWFGSYNGKICFWEKGKFYHADNFPPLRKVKTQSFIRNMFEDEKGNIIISFIKDGIAKISPNFDIQLVKNEEEVQVEFTWLEPISNKVYYISPSKINYVNFQKGYVENHDTFPHLANIARGAIVNEELILGLYNQVFIYDNQSLKIKYTISFPFPVKDIIHVYHSNDVLWLGTRDGVIKVIPKNNTFKDFEFEHYLKGKSVSNILNDREGNIWFTTIESGIYFSLSPDAVHYTSTDGLPESRIYCLSKDFQDRLWIGLTKNRYAVLEEGKISNHQVSTVYLNGEINNIYHANPTETVIISKGVGKQILNGEEYSFTLPRADFIKDRYGYYWSSLWQVYRWSEDQHHRFLKLPNEKFNPGEEQNKNRSFMEKNIVFNHNARVSCFELCPADTIWIGSNHGLYWVEYDSSQILSRASAPVLPYRITDIKYDTKRDLIWAATYSNGLFAFRNLKQVYHITTKEGLGSNICTEIRIGKLGEIWVGTVKGLNRILLDQSGMKVHPFSEAFGLNQIKVDALEVIGEKIYLATEKGLTVLPTYRPVIAKEPPLIYLNNFEVDGKSISLDSTPCLAYHQNAVSFHFSGLSFRDQGQTRFKYRLIGQDDQWLTTYSDLIHFRSLSPGDYCFEVKAVNQRDQESIQSAKHYFSIAPPFWEKTGFRVSSLLFIIGLGYWFWHSRLMRERLKFQLEQKLIQAENEKLELEKNYLDLELRALRLQMNPHFLFNALNTIKGYYAENRQREANAYIAKFAKLLRLILEQPDKYMPLEKEIRLLQFYMDLSKIRYPNKFEYQIDVDPKLQTDNTAIPPMLLQPFVENAIIHGIIPRKNGHGKINIKFKLEGDRLISEVSDNGIGRVAAAKINRPAKHQSKAIEITKERLDIIHSTTNKNGYLKIIDLYEAEQPTGTQIVLQTPYKKIW